MFLVTLYESLDFLLLYLKSGHLALKRALATKILLGKQES